MFVFAAYVHATMALLLEWSKMLCHGFSAAGCCIYSFLSGVLSDFEKCAGIFDAYTPYGREPNPLTQRNWTG